MAGRSSAAIVKAPGSSTVLKKRNTQHPWGNWKTFVQLNMAQNLPINVLLEKTVVSE